MAHRFLCSNDQGTLPTAAGLGLDKPVVLGEFGESTAQGDAHQATVVQNFLNNAKNGGYSGAWYWSLGEETPRERSFWTRLTSGCFDRILRQEPIEPRRRMPR